MCTGAGLYGLFGKTFEDVVRERLCEYRGLAEGSKGVGRPYRGSAIASRLTELRLARGRDSSFGRISGINSLGRM